MSTILIVGAPPPTAQLAKSIIQKGGHNPATASSIEEGIKLAKDLPFGTLLLVKTHIFDGSALDFIKRVREERIMHPVLVFSDMTPASHNAQLCDDMKHLIPCREVRGFLFEKMFDKLLLKEIELNLPSLKKDYFDRTELLPHKSSEVKELRKRINAVAILDGNVLILGESGLCKSTVAHLVHLQSRRNQMPFVTISHCDYQTSGEDDAGCIRCLINDCFKKAEGGTIYLKNLHGFCCKGQVALNAIVDRREYDVHIISSARPSIRELVSCTDFDGVLQLKLSESIIPLPPLREIPEDIETLAKFFLKEFAEQSGMRRCSLSKKALDILKAYHWPHNTLELKMVMYQCATINETGRVEASDLAQFLPIVETNKAKTTPLQQLKKWFMDHFAGGGTIADAASALGVGKRAIYYKLRQCNLDTKGREIYGSMENFY